MVRSYSPTFADDLVGQHDRQVADVVAAVLLADDLADALLVRRVGEDHSSETAIAGLRCPPARAACAARHPRPAGGDPADRVDPLPDADDHGPRDQRHRFALAARLRRSAGAGPVHPLGAAADEDRVLVALGGDQPEPRVRVRSISRFIATVVEYRMISSCGSSDVDGPARLSSATVLEHVDEADRQVVRGGRRLARSSAGRPGEHGSVNVPPTSMSAELSGASEATRSDVIVRPRRGRDHQLARPAPRSRRRQPLLQPVDVDSVSWVIGCPGGRYSVSTWTAARRAVELQDADPLRDRGEGVVALDQRRVDLPGVAVVHQQPRL